MGAYKQFLTSDIIVAPFEVNKGFTFYSSDSSSINSIDNPTVRINRLLGYNVTTSLFYSNDTNIDPVTGYVYPGLEGGEEYQRLVYKSIKQLYYSNYLTSSYSDPINQRTLIPGRDEEGNRYVGATGSQAYFNYLQTTLTYPRFFPTTESCYIAVLSIPNGLFGDYVQPNSFYMEFPSGSFYDDGEGNILTGSNIVGNIIYPHGIVILAGNQNIYNIIAAGGGAAPPSLYASAVYGTNVYGTQDPDWVKTLLNFSNTTDFTCSFSSSYTIYETQYKCTIRENEFNFTLNPSTIRNDSTGSVYGFVTESYFSPYITTVGLYDEDQNLLAVGKLSQPVPSSPTTDTTILINLDR